MFINWNTDFLRRNISLLSHHFRFKLYAYGYLMIYLINFTLTGSIFIMFFFLLCFIGFATSFNQREILLCVSQSIFICHVTVDFFLLSFSQLSSKLLFFFFFFTVFYWLLNFFVTFPCKFYVKESFNGSLNIDFNILCENQNSFVVYFSIKCTEFPIPKKIALNVHVLYWATMHQLIFRFPWLADLWIKIKKTHLNQWHVKLKRIYVFDLN